MYAHLNKNLRFITDASDGGGGDALDQILADANARDAAAASPAPEVEADAEDADDDAGADELGDAGKQALDRMKAKLKAERERRIAAEAKASQGADADETETIRREAETAALAKANARIVRAEVKAAAAGRLNDPTDALNFLDLSRFEVDDDGDVDADEISEAIAELVRTKPYLAAQGGTSKPKPDRSQGAQGSGVATNAQRFERSLEGIL